MPEFRQYPQALSLQATDAFLIERLGVGSMYIEAGDANPYDIAMGYPAAPAPPNTAILVFTVVRDLIIPAGFPISQATAQVVATAPTVLSWRKLPAGGGSATIGTLTFAAATVAGVYASMVDATLAPGDALALVTGSALNGLGNISVTIAAQRDT